MGPAGQAPMRFAGAAHRFLYVAGGLAAFAAIVIAVHASEPGPSGNPDPDARADALVRAMTLDEKIHLLHGTLGFAYEGRPAPDGARGGAGFVPPLPRLGIPAMQLNDGPLGVRNIDGGAEGRATALPSSQALAASFEFCIPWDDAYLTPEGVASIAPGNFGEMHFINNKLKAPYSDQFTLGMRNRVGDWNTSIAWAYIVSYDGVIASPANFFGDGTWYWYDSFHYALNEAVVPNAGGGGLFLFDNAKETKTTQVLMSFDKPYTIESGWSASIAYTYSWAKEKLEFNGDYQLDYPFAYNSLMVQSSQVPKNRLVAIGTVDLPWTMNLGAKFVIESPKPLTTFNGIGTSPGKPIRRTASTTTTSRSRSNREVDSAPWRSTCS